MQAALVAAIGAFAGTAQSPPSFGGAASGAAPRDNVLIVLADDLGVDALGLYGVGARTPPTPHLDALAARGVVFRNAWSFPVCSSTRACLMTGRYGFRTGVGAALPGPPAFPPTGPLSIDEVTLPAVLDLGGSGYAHAAFGKWHLGQVAGERTPNALGWSHFAGLLGGLASYYAWPRTVDGTTATCTTYATTQIVDDALAWIGAQSGPWVCYVAFTAPHAPYHEPPPQLHTRSFAGVGPPSANPRPYYEAMVEAMDTEIGRLLAGLGPQLARTNVLFAGDNGTPPEVTVPPFLPTHAKGTPYDGSVHVPLIAAGPAVAGGRDEPALVSLVDVFATVAELAGIDAAAAAPPWVALDARSFAPSLAAPGASSRSVLYAELFYGSTFASVGKLGFAMLRNDRYKLTRLFSPPLGTTGSGYPRDGLYDLQLDPFEQQNLLLQPLGEAERQQYVALVLELERTLRPAGAVGAFGASGCNGSNGPPSIGISGVPRLGASYDVRLAQGAPGAPAALVLGSSRVQWIGLTLPFDLAVLGAGSGCRLYASIDATAPALVDAAGAASVPVLVPGWPALVGRTLFHTWLIADPAPPAGTLGLTASNGAAAVIGL